MPRHVLATLLPLLALVGVPAPAEAHPHAWIDLRSTVIFTDDGHIEAIEVDWLFDDFYTAFVAEEFVKDPENPTDYLMALAEENLASLAEYDYFLDVRQSDERVALAEAGPPSTGLRDKRLFLRFTVPLAEPLDPAAGPMRFAAYDPSYYTEILYAEDAAPVLPDAAAGCAVRVEPPDPSPEAVALAYSLDVDESGGDGLGRLFAETAIVSCRQNS